MMAGNSKQVSALDEVLQYENRFVVERFVEKHGVSESDAREIFQQTLKMLWLMAVRRQEFESRQILSPTDIRVYRQMSALDEMWHTFLLFSRDYSLFCKKHFGAYLHHLPTTSADREKERQATLADPEKQRAQVKKEVEIQCRYIGQKLGGETLSKWFKEYPARFSI